MSTFAKRFMTSSFFFWLILAGVALYFIIPLRKQLKFGIDLVGGSYITLEVQTDKAIEDVLSDKLRQLSEDFKKSRIKVLAKETLNKSIKIEFENAEAAQDAARMVREDSDLDVLTEANVVTMNLKDFVAQRVADEAVKTDIEVVRGRVDAFGVAESSIAAQGERNIVVELPDTGTQEAKAAIGKSAKLEFRVIEKSAGSKDDLLYEHDGELPEDMQILPGRVNRQLGSPEMYYLVERFSRLTGKLLKSASAGIGGRTGADPVVNIVFDQTGSKRFFDLTRNNRGKRLAIVLDKEVIDAPGIENPIAGGHAYIGPMPSMDFAKELGLLLRSGAYVAPVTFEEERQIGAALGAASIMQGLIACLVGLGLLLVFAIAYYGFSGIFAFLALIYNLILVLFGLHIIGATLTLPGIAGMVLTVGMAIDASILIFENIKEELAKGLTLKKAVNAGFKDVMVVILDANITTFIVGAVLYWVGTGPIQGFAVTLMLGICAILITGLFFLRSLFNFTIDTFKIQKLRF